MKICPSLWINKGIASAGAILDPAIGTAMEIELLPGETMEIAFVAGAASSREGLLSTHKRR